MIKRIRINNDIKVDWTVNIQNSEGEIADLSSFDLAVDLIVGTKVFHVTDFTVSGNLISFVYYGSEQVYTGSYVLKLYDATNTSVTYDVKTAFVLMEHSWFSPDIITVPTSVEIASSVSVAQIIAVPGPKGDVGVESATASIDDIGDVPTVEVTLQDKNLDFAFHGIKGSGGGGGGGGTGKDGRSITSVQNWFKLSASTSVSAPNISIADPSSAAGGGWSLTAGSPTAQSPYLWCFMQVNYDKPLSSGYTYSRSSAYIARRYNSDASQEFEELEEMIEQLRSDMESDMAGYENDLRQLNTSLNNLRTKVEGSMAGDIAALKSRFNNIDGTDVKKIEDDEDGLWGVLTSYDDDTKGQKSFSDIVLDAKNAKQTLSVGSEFFGTRTGAEITLDGLKGQIALKATQDYVDSAIAQAQFSVDPAALKSVISKGQKCWKKGTQLYPYDLYLNGFDGSISEYEEYMGKSPSEGGPEGDGVNPAGPFTIAVTVDQFSNIQQTVDSITSSVYEVKYAWEKDNNIYAYNHFEDDYNNRPSAYDSYTYEEYVTSVLRYTKVEIGNVLSCIIQTSSEIESIVGDMGYMWRKANVDGTYQYQRYAVPSNQTRDEYVAAMQSAGWSLYDYSQKMSVIDQTPENITLAVQNSRLVWIDETEDATSEDYCRDYDYWYEDYEDSSYAGTYEEYVGYFYSSYELTKISDSMSRIKQTSSSISSVVSSVTGLGNRVSAVEQTSDEISASVSDLEDNVSGMSIKTNKIWAGVKSGDDVSASISIIAGASTAAGKSKIILDANNVVINGGLSVGVVDEDQVKDGAITGTKIIGGAITTGHIAANAITSDKIQAGAITADKIAAGAVSTNKLLTAGESGTMNILAQNGLLGIYLGTIYENNLTINRRAAFGIEDGAVVLKFYDENGNELYNLGPGGIVNASGPMTLPKWTALRFYYSNTEFSVGDILSSQNEVTVYKYEDAYRVVNGAIQHLSPFDINNTIPGDSVMHNKYFDDYITSPTQSTYDDYFATPGYYIIDMLMWNQTGYGIKDDYYTPADPSADTDEGFIVLGFRVLDTGEVYSYQTKTRIYKSSSGSSFQYSVRKFEH